MHGTLVRKPIDDSHADAPGFTLGGGKGSPKENYQMTQCVRLVSLAVVGWLAFGSGLASAAGNVIAYNKGGSLVVVGDPAHNDISITPGMASDEFVVTGFGGTTINFSALPQTFVQIIGNFNVDMDDGSDSLVIEDAPVPCRLLVKLGDGDDTFDFTDGTVVGNVSVRGGDGMDDITLSTVLIGGTVTMKSENGDDSIFLDQVTINRNAKLSGGDDDDQMTIAGGSEVVGTLKAGGDGGFDQIDLQDSTFTDVVKVGLGSENDEVILGGVTTTNNVRLDGGANIDTYTDDGGNAFNGGAPTLIKIEIVN
jgi:hypothetical protein